MAVGNVDFRRVEVRPSEAEYLCVDHFEGEADLFATRVHFYGRYLQGIESGEAILGVAWGQHNN